MIKANICDHVNITPKVVHTWYKCLKLPFLLSIKFKVPVYSKISSILMRLLEEIFLVSLFSKALFKASKTSLCEIPREDPKTFVRAESLEMLLILFVLFTKYPESLITFFTTPVLNMI